MPAPASDAPVPAPSVASLLPSATVSDTPTTCDVPFERGGRPTQPVNWRPFPETLRATTGTVTLALVVAVDGSIATVRVLKAPTTDFGAFIAANAGELHMTPAVFRCAPVEAKIFFSVDFKRSAG